MEDEVVVVLGPGRAHRRQRRPRRDARDRRRVVRHAHEPRDARDLADRAVRELEHDVLRRQERALLGDQVRLRLREDAVHVRLRQRVQLHADGQPALELREQIARLRLVERARRDEEDVVRVDVAVLGGDRRPLDERQEVERQHALRRVEARCGRPQAR